MERFLLCSAGMPNQSMYHVVHQWCTASDPHEIYRNISNLNVFLANIQSILQETSRNGFTVVSLVGFLVGFWLYIIDGPNGRPERVHYWRWRSVKSRYSVTHKAGGKTLISGGHKFDPVTLHLSLKLRVLKVSWFQNVLLGSSFRPKY